MLYKPTLKNMLSGVACLFALVQSAAVYSAEMIPVRFLLLNGSSVRQYFPGCNAGQQSAEGGRIYFYDIFTTIDNGTPFYLTSVPAKGKKGNDSGYIFGFYPENAAAYRFQVTASDSMGLMGDPSDWSSDFQVQYRSDVVKPGTSVIADPGDIQVVQTGTEVFFGWQWQL